MFSLKLSINSGVRFMAEFKSYTVRKAIETDEVTYVRVLPDQVCDMPILPMKYPIRQLNWKVTLNKGVVYLPREGIYCRTLEIGYGSWVNCNVFGRESVTIESGESFKGNTFINGSIVSDGTVTIYTPTEESRDKDYKDGCVIVKGNIIGKDVKIEAPTIVYGNVFSDENLIINDLAVVAGGVVSKDVMVQKLTCNFIYGEKLELGNLVSVLTPIVIAKEISFDKIRVITLTCKKCGEENDIDILTCDFNSCEKCLLMTPDDIINFSDFLAITTAWRTLRETQDVYNWLKDVMCNLYNEREKFVDFDKLKDKLKHVSGISRGLKVELDVTITADENKE